MKFETLDNKKSKAVFVGLIGTAALSLGIYKGSQSSQELGPISVQDGRVECREYQDIKYGPATPSMSTHLNFERQTICIHYGESPFAIEDITKAQPEETSLAICSHELPVCKGGGPLQAALAAIAVQRMPIKAKLHREIAKD